MRARQIKNHLTQIILAGVLLYLIIYLVQDEEEPSLAERYEEYQQKQIEKLSSAGDLGRVDRLALSMVEKMHENERLRAKTINTEPPPLPHAPPGVLDTILAQVPGGSEAIAENDQVAVNALQDLVKKYKDNFVKEHFEINGAMSNFAKHLFDGQKMLGALPDIRNDPRFFDPKRLPDKKEETNENPNGQNGENNIINQLSASLQGNAALNNPLLSNLQGDNNALTQLLLKKLNGNAEPQANAGNPVLSALLQQSQGSNGIQDLLGKGKAVANLMNGVQQPNAGVASLGNNGESKQLGDDSRLLALLKAGNAIRKGEHENPTLNLPKGGISNPPDNAMGGLNLHELLRIKNILYDGTGMDRTDKIKELLNLGKPQLIDDSGQGLINALDKNGAAAQLEIVNDVTNDQVKGQGLAEARLTSVEQPAKADIVELNNEKRMQNSAISGKNIAEANLEIPKNLGKNINVEIPDQTSEQGNLQSVENVREQRALFDYDVKMPIREEDNRAQAGGKL